MPRGIESALSRVVVNVLIMAWRARCTHRRQRRGGGNDDNNDDDDYHYYSAAAVCGSFPGPSASPPSHASRHARTQTTARATTADCVRIFIIIIIIIRTPSARSPPSVFARPPRVTGKSCALRRCRGTRVPFAI